MNQITEGKEIDEDKCQNFNTWLFFILTEI